MRTRLPGMALLAFLFSFGLLGAQSECNSKDELVRYGISSQDHGTVQWTPDGSQIVFSGGGKIVLADALGTELQTIPQGPLTTFPFLEDNTPRISPDGSKVVYVTYRYSNGIRKTHSDQIATANLDGSDPQRLTSDRHNYEAPAWSPDGSQITFVSAGRGTMDNEDLYGIFVVDSDGDSNPRMVGPPKDPDLPRKHWYISNPIWSPKGELIVFAMSAYTDEWHGYIAAIKPDGSGYQRLYDSSSSRSLILLPPSFSPDGDRIAFAVYEDESSVIKTMNSDGTDQRTLLKVPTTKAMKKWLAPKTTRPNQHIGHISWSPDGSEIFFVGFPESTDDPQSLGIGFHAIGLDGSGSRPILESYSIKWPVALSPDGSRFAVIQVPYDLVPSRTGGVRHPDDAWYPERAGVKDGDILFTIAADGSDRRLLIREIDEVFVPQHPSRKADAADPVTCSTGRAIQEPEKHQELVRDCETLLATRDDLTGPEGFLNWNPARPMETWHGISIGGSPLRVETIDTGYSRSANVKIYGVLPPQIEDLDGLKELHVDQPLTGPIPPSLGNLANLESLALVNSRPNPEFTLIGKIPPQLGNLTNLRTLVLSGNFTGEVPEELGQMDRLKRLVILRSSLNRVHPLCADLQPRPIYSD